MQIWKKNCGVGGWFVSRSQPLETSITKPRREQNIAHWMNPTSMHWNSEQQKPALSRHLSQCGVYINACCEVCAKDLCYGALIYRFALQYNALRAIHSHSLHWSVCGIEEKQVVCQLFMYSCFVAPFFLIGQSITIIIGVKRTWME